MAVLALDIGGANIKASDGADFCVSRPFPLWKNPQGLSEAIIALVATAPPRGRWAVTMTGELCDCFPTKRDGVAAIVDAVVMAARGVDVGFYLIDGSLVYADEAKRRYLEAAASNWHALAAFVAKRFAGSAGIVVDVGSTTTDILPFAGGRSAVVGRTDPARLGTGELVYTGVVRSPVCAVTPTLPWRGRVCGVAQEWFATTRDAYLILGSIPEDEHDCDTPDGRPATREAARDRLARCVCADRDLFDLHDAQQAALVIRQSQIRRLAESFVRVSQGMGETPRTVVVGGQGEFLARDVLRHANWTGPVVGLSEIWTEAASCIGPAYALAHLAAGTVDSAGSPIPTLSALRPQSMPAAAAVAGALAERRNDLRVVKFGGSALTMAEYVEKLRRWLKMQAGKATIMVVGGGSEVREIAMEQQEEHFSDEEAHWRCVDVMLANAKELLAEMPEGKWLADVDDLAKQAEAGTVLIVDPRRFMELDARRIKGRLPESWDVSSDSIAARLAEHVGAAELVLLKSRLPRNVQRLGEYVDPYFSIASRSLATVRFVNIRDAEFAEMRRG